MPRLRLAACQINTVVGDLDGNADRIVRALGEAERAGARPGRLPRAGRHRLSPRGPLSRPGFVADNLAAVDRVVAASGACAAVFGFVDIDPEGRLFNAAAVCVDGPWWGPTTSACCPTTASSTSSAGSPLGPSRTSATWWPGCRWACRSARTCGSPAARWPTRGGPGPGWWSISTPRRTRSGDASDRLAVLAERVGRDRLRHRLCQPGRRPGRAGLRRRLPGDGPER